MYSCRPALEEMLQKNSSGKEGIQVTTWICIIKSDGNGINECENKVNFPSFSLFWDIGLCKTKRAMDMVHGWWKSKMSNNYSTKGGGGIGNTLV